MLSSSNEGKGHYLNESPRASTGTCEVCYDFEFGANISKYCSKMTV